MWELWDQTFRKQLLQATKLPDPYRIAYPQDHRQFWKKKRAWSGIGTTGISSSLPTPPGNPTIARDEKWWPASLTERGTATIESNTETRGVAGTCVNLDNPGWLKLGPRGPPVTKRWWTYLLGETIKPLIVFRNNLSFFFHPKRAADPAMLGVGYIVSPLIAHS